MKRTVLFRTMNKQKKKIENSSIDEVTELMSSILDKVEFITRARGYRTIEVQFENEEIG